MNSKNYLTEIKELISKSDVILIGAGAGLSASAGIRYGTEYFNENFPELVKIYNMTDMYHSSFYNFKTNEERWSYFAKHVGYIYNDKVKECYLNLFALVKNKEHFVITTNVDGQFLKAGFDKDKVFEIQGSLSKIQCSVGCHNKLYNDLELVDTMLKNNIVNKIPTNLIPICPVCGAQMELNLRKDAFFVEDNNWIKMNNRYEKFLQFNRDKNILLLELGVGFNTPGIIRYPFEKMTYSFKNVKLVRINSEYPFVPEEIEKKTICVKMDIASIINEVVKG